MTFQVGRPWSPSDLLETVVSFRESRGERDDQPKIFYTDEGDNSLFQYLFLYQNMSHQVKFLTLVLFT